MYDVGNIYLYHWHDFRVINRFELKRVKETEGPNSFLLQIDRNIVN